VSTALDGDRPVLIVDDDPVMRQALREAFEDEGIAVETASDGREALRKVADRLPALVVLDVTLPVLDGFQVADQLRAGARPVPILAITGDGQAPEKARRMGAFAYLRKPFELSDLLRLVQGALTD
jgi:two-component system, OmpR family, response regulator MprA